MSHVGGENPSEMKSSISLHELESKYASPDADIPADFLRRLRRDPRKGARRLSAKLTKRQEKARLEGERVNAMFRFERELWAGGVSRVAGVDEVGIGPMAGPVVAAAVVFEQGVAIPGVDDSKRLEPEVREDLDTDIRSRAVAVHVGVVETPEVDRLNVYHAGLLAMHRAVIGLSPRPEHVLVDARTIPDLPIPQDGLVGGDRRSFSIAAASIVAKVHRDRLMVKLDREYPGYGFARHKGYCSPEHQKAVQELGPCPVHRHSLDFIRELRGEYDQAFYRLKQAVSQLRTRAGYEEWDAELVNARERLSPTARRKLRALAARRREQVGW